jgi:hypothetical protein
MAVNQKPRQLLQLSTNKNLTAGESRSILLMREEEEAAAAAEVDTVEAEAVGTAEEEEEAMVEAATVAREAAMVVKEAVMEAKEAIPAEVTKQYPLVHNVLKILNHSLPPSSYIVRFNHATLSP